MSITRVTCTRSWVVWFLGYGLLNIASAASTCGDNGEFPSKGEQNAFCVGMVTPALLGLGMTIWGLVVNSGSKSALSDTSRSLAEPAVGPNGPYAPYAPYSPGQARPGPVQPPPAWSAPAPVAPPPASSAAPPPPSSSVAPAPSVAPPPAPSAAPAPNAAPSPSAARQLPLPAPSFRATRSSAWDTRRPAGDRIVQE